MSLGDRNSAPATPLNKWLLKGDGRNERIFESFVASEGGL